MRFFIVALALMAMFSTASELCDSCSAEYFRQGGCDDLSLRESFESSDCETCLTELDEFCKKSLCDKAKKMISSDGFCKATFAGSIDGTDFAIGYPNVNLVAKLPMYSASTLLAASFLLKLTERRIFKFDKPLGKYIDWWTNDPSDNRSKVTLKHLLSMTSGFGEASCAFAHSHDNFYFDHLNSETCAHWIYDNFFGDFRGEHGAIPIPEETRTYSNAEVTPGKFAVYAESNWQIALYLAEAASGQKWNDLFTKYFNDELDINEKNCYWGDHLSSIIDPGLSLICTAGDYLKFLRQLNAGYYIKHRTMKQQQTAWTKKFNSETKGIMKDLHGGGDVFYGLGGWVTKCDDTNYCSMIESAGYAGTLPFSGEGAFGILARYEFHEQAATESFDKAFALFDILKQMSVDELTSCTSDMNKDVDYWKHGMDHATYTGEDYSGMSLGLCDPPKEGEKDYMTVEKGATIKNDPCDTCLLYFYAEKGCLHMKDPDFKAADYLPRSCHHLVSTQDSQCTAVAKTRCESGKPIYNFNKYSMLLKKKNLQGDMKPFVPFLSPIAESFVGDGETLETFTAHSQEPILFQTKNIIAFFFGLGFLAIIANVYRMRRKEQRNNNDFQLFLTDVDEI